MWPKVIFRTARVITMTAPNTNFKRKISHSITEFPDLWLNNLNFFKNLNCSLCHPLNTAARGGHIIRSTAIRQPLGVY